MTLAMFWALFTFAGIAAWTPGPNNTILMSSGLTHGFRKTVPMIFGVGLGFPLMIGLIGLGLGEVFETVPQLYTVMKFAGTAYMVVLAWKIATSVPSMGEGESSSKPLSFIEGAAFQWINPKAWIMALTANSAYTSSSNFTASLGIVVATFILMGFSSASAWTLFGTSLRQLMSNPKWFRALNIALAISLLLSLIPIWKS